MLQQVLCCTIKKTCYCLFFPPGVLEHFVHLENLVLLIFRDFSAYRSYTDSILIDPPLELVRCHLYLWLGSPENFAKCPYRYSTTVDKQRAGFVERSEIM